MSELNRAPFTRKRHCARSVARFCWTLSYINDFPTQVAGGYKVHTLNVRGTVRDEYINHF